MSDTHPFRRTVLTTVVGILLVWAATSELAAQVAHGCARSATGIITVHGPVASGIPLGVCTANSDWARVVPWPMGTSPATANAALTGTISSTYFPGHLYLGFTVGSGDPAAG